MQSANLHIEYLRKGTAAEKKACLILIIREAGKWSR